MSRSRNIKPGLFRNEVLGTADPLLTILFEALWCLADRDGILEDRPLRIKADAFPYRDIRDMDGMLSELDRMGFITRYAVGSLRLIAVREFAKHQNPHKNEKPSGLPSLSERTDVVGSEPAKIGSARADSFNLIPDSGFPSPAEKSAGLVDVVLAAYHATLPNCARVEVMNPKRAKRIQLANKLAKQVCEQQDWDFDPQGFWEGYFGECLADPWLRGDVPHAKNPRWKQNLHVLIEEDRFAEIMDRAITRMKAENA